MPTPSKLDPKGYIEVVEDKHDTPLALMDDFSSDDGGGFDNVTRDDLVFPRLTILQPTASLSSDDGYRPGNFINSVDKHNFGGTFVGYPVYYWVSRISWAGGDLGTIDCISRDGQHGSKTDAAHGGGECLSCPLAAVQKIRKPDGTLMDAVPCTLYKNLMFVPLDESTPLIFSGKRTGIKAVNTFLTLAKSAKRPDAPKTHSPAIYDFTWQLSAEKTQNERGTFYVPKFTRGEPTPLDVRRRLQVMYKEIKASQAYIAHVEEDRSEIEDSEPAPF
jgi:hypothetical protein